MKRAALYLRVSTDKQTTENQRPELEQAARARGYEPEVFTETESAKKRRPVFERVMERAQRGHFEAVFVVALDRLGRSMKGVMDTVLTLDRAGVRLVSLRETWLDSEGPARSLLLAVFGWVAEYERDTLISRTKSGIQRARREGKHIGRPRAAPVKVLSAVAAVKEKGARIPVAAKAWGVSESTLRRALKSHGPAKTLTMEGSTDPQFQQPVS